MSDVAKKLIMKPGKTAIYCTVASGTGYGIVISLIILFLTNQENININLKITLFVSSFFLIMSGMISYIINIRNSLFSHEVLIAIITFIFILCFYTVWITINNSETSFILISIASSLSLITIFFTTKIYLTFKTVLSWYNFFSIITYIFNALVLGSLILFSLLFYFNIENKLLTNFIIIISLSTLFIKLLSWYLISKYNKNNNDIVKNLNKLQTTNSFKGTQIKNNFLTSEAIKEIENINFFSLRSICCILTYITPTYYIIQRPYLIISDFVSAITFAIITTLAILGMFIERWLFFVESQYNSNLFYENY